MSDREHDRNGPLAAQIGQPRRAPNRAVGAHEAAVQAHHAHGVDAGVGQLVDDLAVEVARGALGESRGLGRGQVEHALSAAHDGARGFERPLGGFAGAVHDHEAVAARVVPRAEVAGEAGEKERVAEEVGVEVEDVHREGVGAPEAEGATGARGRTPEDEKPLAAFHTHSTGPLQAILRTADTTARLSFVSFAHHLPTSMRILRISALTLLAVVFAACDNGSQTRTFVADLSALNDSGVSGDVFITVDNDGGVVNVELNATGLDDTLHAQHVHAVGGMKSSCPSASDDANSDGFVDVLEGLPKYGPILLPLDNDISNADANADGFPSGTTITYNTSADRSGVANAVDNDGFLDFQDWAIVVHGTTEDLPATVATIPDSGLPNQVTLPVACGALRFQ